MGTPAQNRKQQLDYWQKMHKDQLKDLVKKIDAETNYYCIYVTPANKNFLPHVWTEGGLYSNKNLANQYAGQLRKNKQEYDGRKNFYAKVEVILSTDERVIVPKPYHKSDGLNLFRDIVRRSKTTAEACENIRKIHGIPEVVSNKFFELYGINGSRSPEKAVEKMRDEISNCN